MLRRQRLQLPTDLPQLAALRHRDYRSTWLAGTFSGAAMWTLIVATTWLVLEKSGSSGWVGIITFSSMVPALFVSPVGGLMGDMYDRRTLAMLMFMLSAALVGTLALLAITDVVELWHVAALSFALGVTRYVREPAMQALIPNQVPKEDLLNALVLNGASRHGARFFGLAIAAPLLVTDNIGVDGVLVLSALFHVLGAVMMARTATVSSGATRPEQGFLSKIADGLVYIYTHHAIALFVILVAFHCALVMSFESMLPIFSKDSLGATDASIIGYLAMGFGAGAMVSLLALAGVRDERRKGQLLMLTGLVSGITPILLAASGNVPVAVLAAAGMGASQATFMAITNTYVQTMAPDRLRARISSLYVLHAGGIMAFANLGYGFMADAFSAPMVLVATGALFVVVFASLGAAEPLLRQVYRTGQVVAA